MKTESHKLEASSPVELAAGGLIWSNQDSHAKLFIVHRAKYDDWSLPKGRPEPGEALELTAKREAMEEIGCQVELRQFAGSYSYAKGGTTKIVVMWHMVRKSDPYKGDAPKNEIVEVALVTARQAIERLTHQSERDFVMTHCLVEGARPARFKKSKPELIRLAAWINSVQGRFIGYTIASGETAAGWWGTCVRHSLKAANSALRRGDLDGGWGAVHDAERFMVFGMSIEELLAKAASLSAETRTKLKGWRAEAAKQLFTPIAFHEWAKSPSTLTSEHRSLLQRVLVEALEILHGYSDNVYHRMHLVGQQLRWLVVTCASLLTAVFGLAYWYAPGDDLGFSALAPVALAGAFGGVVSAMYQLSRVGQAKIPEALLHGLVTSGRPLIGACAALFIYVVLKSEVINLVDAANITLMTGLVLGFVAGFSEHFVLSTVAKVAGAEKDQTGK